MAKPIRNPIYLLKDCFWAHLDSIFELPLCSNLSKSLFPPKDEFESLFFMCFLSYLYVKTYPKWNYYFRAPVDYQISNLYYLATKNSIEDWLPRLFPCLFVLPQLLVGFERLFPTWKVDHGLNNATKAMVGICFCLCPSETPSPLNMMGQQTRKIVLKPKPSLRSEIRCCSLRDKMLHQKLLNVLFLLTKT